jgi:hypothetical protein
MVRAITNKIHVQHYAGSEDYHDLEIFRPSSSLQFA